MEIVVADSKSYPNEGLSVDLLFIDGDYIYEGVRKDYEHWIKVLKPGGHILFHDARDSDSYRVAHAGIKKLDKELDTDTNLVKAREIATLVHFIKK